MRRKRDDDSFANSTQCDSSQLDGASHVENSSQADYSQADLSQADISQASRADSMRTRPPRKRRRTIIDALNHLNFDSGAMQPLQHLELHDENDASSLAAGGPVSGDENSLTSDSEDEQLNGQLPNPQRKVALELAATPRASTHSKQPGRAAMPIIDPSLLPPPSRIEPAKSLDDLHVSAAYQRPTPTIDETDDRRNMKRSNSLPPGFSAEDTGTMDTS